MYHLRSPIQTLFLAASLLVVSAKADELQPLSPEQQETVKQLKEQMRRSRYAGFSKYAETLGDIDPVLVGKYVVFSKDWLKYIGQELSRQQLEQWRNNTDKIYESFEKLTGAPPNNGRKVFITIEPIETHGATTNVAYNRINFNENGAAMSWRAVRGGSWNRIMIHEMAHIFDNGKAWNAETESIAEFMVMYVYENTDAWRGERSRTAPKTTYRQQRYNIAWSEYRQSVADRPSVADQQPVVDRPSVADRPSGSDIEAKKEEGKKLETFVPYRGGAYNCYLLGLVEKVGWGPVEKAFQSYNDYPPNYNSVPRGETRQKARARDFFERIAYFSDKPDVLHSLPDKGALLDEHFNAEPSTATKRLLASSTASPNTAAPPPSTTYAPNRRGAFGTRRR